MDDLLEQLLQIAEELHIHPSDLLTGCRHPKVIPMLRGQALASEAVSALQPHIGLDFLTGLSKINANQGNPDVDITITSRRILSDKYRMESKSSVRGSATKTLSGFSFKVKNHKSRTPIRDRNRSGDRYTLDHCDLVISNPYNAFLEGDQDSNFIMLAPMVEHLQSLGIPDITEYLRTKCWVWARPADITDKSQSMCMMRTPTVVFAHGQPIAPWYPLSLLKPELTTTTKMKQKIYKKPEQDFFFKA